MVEQIIAACDGASKGNPGPAGWGWVVAGPDGGPGRWEAGPLGTATNNVAELTALAELLDSTDPSAPLQVRMDSQYAMNAVTKWLPGWKRKGWKTSSGSPVANQDLIVRIDEALTGRPVEFVHVAAHQVGGDPLNAVADQAASDAAVTQRAAGTRHGAAEPPVPDPASATGRPAAAKRPAKRAATGSAAKSGGSGGATLKAKFPGRCRCGTPYAAGEQIAKNPQGWGHPACRTVDA
ncbi:ribonuclease H [Streptomyces sp. SL13]|uniref:Ribonuclease H n=1 Tax=Streptantibioticus silvisoli TaxID=2705255 RepID=A0AA90KIX1_9ACTN|nr:ribonuclease H [Streptantibioticus silvisoli]MDI5966553.1 ribonuclease H [Streptantibioticus silvisoli]MDI5973815.1 ribonuclease H [Streptantibioticus silvisoli]